MKNPKEDPEEKKYLAVILKKLEDKGMCDMDWDENDVYESANKELNYKRYHIDKKQLGKLTNQTTEKEGFLYAAMCLWAVCYSILFATVLVVTISNNVDCYSIVCVRILRVRAVQVYRFKTCKAVKELLHNMVLIA